MTRAARRWLAMIFLLVAQAEWVLPSHFAVRTAIRDTLLHLPAYHMVLAFLVFAMLVRAVAGDRLPPLAEAPLSGPWLGANMAWYGLIAYGLTPLWNFSAGLGGLACALLWLAVLGAYGFTWLAAALPLRLWPSEARAHGPWLLGSLLAGSLSVFLSRISDLLWRHLAAGTFYFSDKLLRLWFPDTIVNVDTLTIGSPSFAVQIGPGCSGYEGIGLIATFGIAYLWLRRKDLNMRRAVWILPATMAVIWLVNSFRIAAIVALGTLLSPQVAIRGFHSEAGWISFSIIGIGLVLLVEKLAWFRHTDTTGRERVDYPAAAFVVPFLTLIFARMICQAFSIEFDIFYPLRVLVLAWVLMLFWDQWRPLVRAVAWRYSVLLGLGVYVFWMALVPGVNDPTGDPFRHLATPWSDVWILGRVVGAVVLVPVIEELAFRGYLLRRIQTTEFDTVAIGHLTTASLLASSICFGLLHGDGPRTWIAGTGAGLAYAYATRHGGRLGDAVVAHGVTNLCLALQVLLWHQWSLWS